MADSFLYQEVQKPQSKSVDRNKYQNVRRKIRCQIEFLLTIRHVSKAAAKKKKKNFGVVLFLRPPLRTRNLGFHYMDFGEN
jgi:hypothetical protein